MIIQSRKNSGKDGKTERFDIFSAVLLHIWNKRIQDVTEMKQNHRHHAGKSVSGKRSS